jgi:hypothetical protein
MPPPKRACLLITDVTRMREDHVCVAALDERGRSVRPLPGVNVNHRRSDLRTPGGEVVRPRALVEGSFVAPGGLRPPHLEDLVYQKAGLRIPAVLSQQEFTARLKSSCLRGVADLYGSGLRGAPRAYLAGGTGHCSLGTVSPARPPRLRLAAYQGKLRVRLEFETERDDSPWDFPVADLAAFGHIESQLGKLALPKLESTINAGLARSRSVYLRLGLARPFQAGLYSESRCYVQVIGIHTDPDYLAGRCWADFYG